MEGNFGFCTTMRGGGLLTKSGAAAIRLVCGEVHPAMMRTIAAAKTTHEIFVANEFVILRRNVGKLAPSFREPLD
jgi:hypothetical protein